MAKINATYSSGYYISPDTDYRAREDERSLARKRLRAEQRHTDRGGPSAASDDLPQGPVKRQTFALPFNIYCESCHKMMPRGSHVYTNRRASPRKYLNAIRIWVLEVRCRFCQLVWELETDPATPKETGGYICVKGCERQGGDFAELNAQNVRVREEWAKSAQEKEETPLEALERTNEAARKLAAHHRMIEAIVTSRADEDDEAVLAGIKQQQQSGTSASSRAWSKLLTSASLLPGGNTAMGQEVDGEGGAGEDAIRKGEEEDELAYQQFEVERLMAERINADPHTLHRPWHVTTAQDDLLVNEASMKLDRMLATPLFGERVAGGGASTDSLKAMVTTATTQRGNAFLADDDEDE